MIPSNNLFTILHLSDLHRNADGVVENDQLYTSLILDSDNYGNEKFENIPKPSVIVISGDIIFGSQNHNDKIARKEIKAQYDEASKFLNMLVDEFLNGDKNRIIIIPGNHDVQWGVSKKSMEKINHLLMTEEEKKKNTWDLGDPKKNVRWSWEELNFYRIHDESMYNSRMSLFSKFYSKFYNEKRTYSLNPDEQFEIFDIPSFNLTIVGYNSCYRNDHLNLSGLINSKCLSTAYTKIREYQKKGRIMFATWHHHFSGIPSDNTYLDPRQLQSLNSYGFSLGFHGHQHRSDIVENYVQFDNSKKLIAISAGTLCSARSHLPTGFKRQYNLLKLNRIEKTCQLFSRESIGSMDDIPIWDKGRINESLNSSLDLDINFPAAVNIYNLTNAEIDSLTLFLKNDKFLDFLESVKYLSTENELIRSMLVEFDENSKGVYRKQVCQLLLEPRQFKESIIFLNYYIENGKKEKAAVLLNNAILENSANKLLIEELNKYKIRLDGY